MSTSSGFAADSAVVTDELAESRTTNRVLLAALVGFEGPVLRAGLAPRAGGADMAPVNAEPMPNADLT